MKPSDRELYDIDFLCGPFVAFPYALMEQYADLELNPEKVLFLLQILGSSQQRQTTVLSAQEIARLCKLTTQRVMDLVEELVRDGLLAIGERMDSQGVQTHYYDLKPLFMRLRGKDSRKDLGREWQHNPVTLFEEEFGRPLSGLECEKIRQWLDLDGHPEWMLIEALREAVLANKFSFKYIDRILFDWHRNRVRTPQELDDYRQKYRDRQLAREETAATVAKRQGARPAQRQAAKPPPSRDGRYAAFYELFPDS